MTDYEGTSGPERWCENGDFIYPIGGTICHPEGGTTNWDGYAVAQYGTDEWRKSVPHTPGEPPEHIREEVEEIIREWRRSF